MAASKAFANVLFPGENRRNQLIYIGISFQLVKRGIYALKTLAAIVYER